MAVTVDIVTIGIFLTFGLAMIVLGWRLHDDYSGRFYFMALMASMIMIAWIIASGQVQYQSVFDQTTGLYVNQYVDAVPFIFLFVFEFIGSVVMIWRDAAGNGM